MKKITLLIALMITSLGFAQNYLPFTFTNPSSIITGSGDGSVVTFTTDGAEPVLSIAGVGGTWDHAKLPLGRMVDLSNDAANTITLRINPQGITGTRTHLLKFESGTVGTNGEVWFTTTDSGWQNITCDFPAGLGKYPQLILFTDAGSASNGYNNSAIGTYLVDDIQGASNVTSFSSNFPFTFSDPSQLMLGAEGTVPTLTTDGAEAVLQLAGGGATWDHGKMCIANLADLSDDANNTITFRINPQGITGTRTHLLKFEAGTINQNAEVWYTTTDSGWQNITLNYPAGLGKYALMVFMTDAGSAGNGYNNTATGTYLIDDISLSSALSTAKFDRTSIKMYPNPVRNTLTIDANSSIQKVSVYNILGQEVMSVSPKSNSATLQTGSLQKGAYMVRTEIDGNVSTSKIIKE
ncbi:MAG: hypothetical protein C0412_03835 [Flavobacterium sp.]|nr:hypothetical protein [Flavobacterium sp.]